VVINNAGLSRLTQFHFALFVGFFSGLTGNTLEQAPPPLESPPPAWEKFSARRMPWGSANPSAAQGSAGRATARTIAKSLNFNCIDLSRLCLTAPEKDLELGISGKWTMPSAKTKRIAPEIDAKLWDELVAVAKQNGQSQRYVLEQALAHYLHNVVPSQHLVRPQVVDAFERSVGRNRDLLERLAK